MKALGRKEMGELKRAKPQFFALTLKYESKETIEAARIGTN